RYSEKGKPRARGGKDPLAQPMGGVSRSEYLVVEFYVVRPVCGTGSCAAGRSLGILSISFRAEQKTNVCV
ncbi:MAG TPA: hypothetical protein PKL92_10790, partial [Aquaticitalea sp.]|nr:hypothetical protein [Aquaticitalea sp.]